MKKIMLGTFLTLAASSSFASVEKGDVLFTKIDLSLQAGKEIQVEHRSNSKLNCYLYAKNKSEDEVLVSSRSRLIIESTESYVQRSRLINASSRGRIEMKLDNAEVYFTIACYGHDELIAFAPSLSKIVKLFSDQLEK